MLGLLLMLQSCIEESAKTHTATANVTVLEQIFTIEQLNRQRNLRIYLPPDYETTEHHYPVLYMHDAQNIFDDATSYAGEWGVDETLNRLAKEQGLSLIVVGIDNGAELRMNELSPWPNKDFGAAEGEQYMDFIVHVVKPYIDENYRTLKDQNNTAIMGSSMGGLISHYGIFKYADFFSKAGIFSPSFWFSEQVFPFSMPEKLAANSRLYFLVGGEEGADVVADVNKMTTQLVNNGFNKNNLVSKVVAKGEHNELFWRTEFPEAILWMFQQQ